VSGAVRAGLAFFVRFCRSLFVTPFQSVRAGAFVLALVAIVVAPATAQTVTNIVNARSSGEAPYASVRGWDVRSGAIAGRFAYCAAEMRTGGTRLRLGYDNAQWQLAVPYPARPDYQGSMEIDGRQIPLSGTSDGTWTFGWLTRGDLDAIRNGNQLILDIGKASLDYQLVGAAAAILKIEECVERQGRGGVAARPPMSVPPMPAPPMPVPPMPGQAMAAAQPATPPPPAAGKPVNTAGGVYYRFPYAKIGGWEILRFAADKRGRETSYCTATLLTGSEQGVRVLLSTAYFQYGFSSLATAALGDQVPVRMWFDAEPAGEDMTADLVADENGFEWLMFSDDISDGPGHEDSFSNHPQVNFAYAVDGKRRVATFRLKDSNAAVKRLIGCRDGR
jgi:hypothetical protein